MAVSSSSFAWDRVRGEEHGGAFRRAEGVFVGAGAGATPQCFRCKGEKKGGECFIVTEEMDVEQEKKVHNEYRDSGMETDGEMELFPEE